MFFDIIMLLITFVLNAVRLAFSVVNFVLPVQIPNAFATFFSYVHLAGGILPFLPDAMLALFTVISVWVILYGVKIVLMVYGLIPGIGRTVSLPQHPITGSSSVHSSYDVHGDKARISRTFTKKTR